MSGVDIDQDVQQSRLGPTEPQMSLITDEEILDYSLALFDFSTPLPNKQDGVWQIFYNNCNGLEVNNMISAYIQQKKDKKRYIYLKDTETPTKLDSLSGK